MTIRLKLAALTLLALAAACGGQEQREGAPSAGAAPSAPAVSTVPATGKVIEITMHTDEKGNYFQPAKFEAHAGDVLRFKLVTGVHNVHFLADSNPQGAALPGASAFLQLPGQTLDVPLTFGRGHFYFQCDPHAMLGMIGRVEVAD